MTRIKLITTYLDHKMGAIIEEDEGKAKELVELGRAEYLPEIPKAKNKMINMLGRRKYKKVKKNKK